MQSTSMKLVYALLIFLLPKTVKAVIPDRACEVHYKPGDALIGGIFPVYKSDNSPCDGGLREKRIAMLEALAYAVNVINSRDDILTNTSLGFEVRNDCSNEDVSLWTMFTLISNEGDKEFQIACSNHSRDGSSPIFGIIGTSRSSTSLLAAKVGGVFHVPVVSYYATSDELSDFNRFPYFFRTIPSDKFQVDAIVDILNHYKWKYIALFYSIDTYGIHGARQIRTLAENFNICIAVNLPVSSQASTKERDDIAKKLIENDYVSVIVTFSLWSTAKAVLQAITDSKINRKFTFIGSDGWGPDLRDEVLTFSDILIGGLFIRAYNPTTPSFHDYYKQLPFKQDQASQWYLKELTEIFREKNCSEWDSCPIPKPHLETRIINAVYALAYTLNASIEQNCPKNNLCKEALNGPSIKSHLLNVTFMTEQNSSFHFDKNGDQLGIYNIKNWQQVNETSQIETVGVWNPEHKKSRLELNDHLIQWGTPNEEVPISICMEKCKPGHISVPLQKQCCMGCQACPPFAIVINSTNGSTSSFCHKCPLTQWPDAKYTTCLPINPAFISYKSFEFILIAVFAGLGLLLIAFTAIGLWYNSQHVLIKASSRELCYIHIIGMAGSCVVVFLNCIRPTEVICKVTDILMSSFICITFTPILLKVNRIWRIFNAKKATKPRYTSPEHQICFALMMISIEV